MGKSNHPSIPPQAPNQAGARSDDSAEEGRPTDKAATETTTPKRSSKQELQNQATIEEFGREGMGVAAKE